ncbi:MAG: RcnB family protein [Parasphingorhabdus sp.]|uniref:RcnB family protein n=1 Tax=Parasphingorhabdus sp. TaxID=2709688 RepID=UPI00300167BF
MKTLLFASLAGAMAMMPAGASAAIDSVNGGSAAQAPMNMSYTSAAALASGAQGAKKMTNGMAAHKTGGGHGFHDGAKVRMGRMGYTRGYLRPHRGFRLPSTFIQPSFYIANYGNYGLRQPSYGYGWSRYYDDAVLTDRSGIVYDSVNNLDWDRYNQGYNDGYSAGQATYDKSVLMGDDRVIATPSGAHGGSTTYQGDWDGAYQDDGSYQGDWQGTYRDAEGQVYEGQYSGTFIGDGSAVQAGASYAEGPHWSSTGPVNDYKAPRDEAPRHAEQRYDSREDELAYLERCKKSSGIGGAVVGGAIGALAGNRIAGSGNRLGGSLIGAGVGAVAGAAIDHGTDKCRQLIKKYGQEYHAQPQYSGPQYTQHHAPQYRAPQAYPTGWQGGYYYPAYYQPAVTTVVIQSAPVTTTTTTTYIEEEVIYTKASAAKKRWKPAPKTVWKAKPKQQTPAPVKGCQQECCLYCE